MSQQARGFTLIEILVVLGITAVLASATMSAFSRFNSAQVIEAEASRSLALIADARARALAAKDNEPHGIHFESGAVVLFQGDTYTAGAADNYEFLLNSRVRITDITLTGGGSEVVFSRITGSTEESGSVTLSLTGSSRSVVITIDPSGIAYVE